jgi:hypothetical protein
LQAEVQFNNFGTPLAQVPTQLLAEALNWLKGKFKLPTLSIKGSD